MQIQQTNVNDMRDEREEEGLRMASLSYLWVVLRIALGWIFLWSSLDKLFGFGFVTEANSAWLTTGTSPTYGYLNFATYGPLAEVMQSMAGNPIVDVLFVGGQLLIGLSLILGIGLQIAGYSGTLLMILIYLSRFPPETNPIIDEHIVYAILLVSIAIKKPGRLLGLGRKWANTGLVSRFPVLE